MATVRFVIEGETILVMHNGRLSDPDNEYAVKIKEITSKQKKTPEDREEICRLEFEGGLYHDPKIGPYVPVENIEAAIIEAGKLSRLGAGLERSMNVFAADTIGRQVKLEYKGPREIAKMLASTDPRFAYTVIVNLRGGKKGGGKGPRTRPAFMPGWRLDFSVHYKERLVSRDNIINTVRDMCELTGLLDGRPRNGKSTIVSIDGKEVANEE